MLQQDFVVGTAPGEAGFIHKGILLVYKTSFTWILILCKSTTKYYNFIS